MLIDLTTASGVVGRSYVFTCTRLALEATRRLVATLGGAIEGEAVSPVDIERYFAHRLRLVGKTGIALMACAGIDVPLVTLLDGTPRPLPAYDSHSMDGKALGVEHAARARNEGYQATKTKIGDATLEEDLEIVRAPRKVTGPAMSIMVDFNQGLTVPEATRRIHVLQDEGLAWVEEPTLQEDYRGHAAIRAKAAVPIQMGENWLGVDEMAKALDAGACDLAMPDAMKIGGVTGWLRAAALAQVRGIPMSSHIFREVSAHLLAVTPTAHWLERMDLARPILERPLAFSGGRATVSSEPGTGIRWNEDAVDRHLT